MPINCFPVCMTSTVFSCGFLSSSEILSMASTPVMIVPACGEGYMNVVLDIHLYLQYNSKPYENGSDLLLTVGDVEFMRCFSKEWVCVSENTMSFFKPYADNHFRSAEIDNMTNQPVYMKAAGVEYTNGDSVIHYGVLYGALPIHHYPY